MKKQAYLSDSDFELVDKSLAGDHNALEEIILRYKDILFNAMLRMDGDYHASQDLTQEVLIKVVTKLSQFRKQSSLKTWILRIGVNHFLSSGQRSREKIFSDFPDHSSILDSLPEQLPSGLSAPEQALLVKEQKNLCLEGMLLCLSREQRIVFVLGAIMALDSREGASILGLTREAFRKRLSRTRKELSNYMNGRCGLINPGNPCRCSQKARSSLQAGYLTPDRMLFNKAHLAHVSAFIGGKSSSPADEMMDRLAAVYRGLPVLEMDRSVVPDILKSREFAQIIDFGSPGGMG